MNPTSIELEADPIRILVLEDEEGIGAKIAETNAKQGAVVTVVPSPEAASAAIANEDFDMIIVDVFLGDGLESGDQWLMRHLSSLGGTSCAVLTGDRSRMSADESAFHEAGIPIILKGVEGVQYLATRVRSIVLSRELERARESLVQSDIGFEPANVEDEMRMLFTDWLNRSSKEGEGVELWAGPRRMGPRDLAIDARNQGEISRQLLPLFMNDLSRMMRERSEHDDQP